MCHGLSEMRSSSSCWLHSTGVSAPGTSILFAKKMIGRGLRLTSGCLRSSSSSFFATHMRILWKVTNEACCGWQSPVRRIHNENDGFYTIVVVFPEGSVAWLPRHVKASEREIVNLFKECCSDYIVPGRHTWNSSVWKPTVGVASNVSLSRNCREWLIPLSESGVLPSWVSCVEWATTCRYYPVPERECVPLVFCIAHLIAAVTLSGLILYYSRAIWIINNRLKVKYNFYYFFYLLE